MIPSGNHSALLNLCDGFPPSLVWLDEHGIGYYPVHDTPYDAAYFQKYQGYARTELGRKLTRTRSELVGAYISNSRVTDVGIGCGAFVRYHDGAVGYDVNPAGVQWLLEHRKWSNPYEEEVRHACFWDSLEHIADPSLLLNRVQESVFVSIPIFTGLDHVRRSKHFRRDEHYWYFTSSGFIQYMRALGWRCVERNWMETDLGREDIETYAFIRG